MTAMDDSALDKEKLVRRGGWQGRGELVTLSQLARLDISEAEVF